MRGGALEIRDFNNVPVEITEQDFQKMDQIQVEFTNFLERNLGMSGSYSKGLRSGVIDTGESDPRNWKDLLFFTDRARMYWLLTEALGRVPMPRHIECGTEYKCIFLTWGEICRLINDMWTQDHGRSGARNRYMGILATELEHQRDAYKDVREYEGHPLPDFLPFVLAESEWDQIYEDVIDNWDDYDPQDDDGGPESESRYIQSLEEYSETLNGEPPF